MPAKRSVYLDGHATTPLDPAVWKRMKPFFETYYANAASPHEAGKIASRAVERARSQVAAMIGAEAKEIVFTSGATESNNLAIKGIAEANREKGRHIVTVATEHKSVLDPCRRLEQQGFKVTVLAVNRSGEMDLKELQSSLRADTVLVTVMAANNETGVIHPVSKIAEIVHQKGALFHCDAVPAAARLELNVKKLNVDTLSITAHKMHGPKGVGALFIRKTSSQVKLLPQLDGGAQEGGLRSGTLNVPAIVGFGEACSLAKKKLASETAQLAKLRDRLQSNLLSAFPEAEVHGSSQNRLPHNLNISLGVPSREIIAALKSVALSAGSACTSTSAEASYVLKAMGIAEEERQSAIRIGLHRFLSQADVDFASREIIRIVHKLRSGR
jgi:cysteine desulfurase